jgi:hypothetical protein
MVQRRSNLFDTCDTPRPRSRIEFGTHPQYGLGLSVAYAMANSLTIDREF